VKVLPLTPQPSQTKLLFPIARKENIKRRRRSLRMTGKARKRKPPPLSLLQRDPS